MSNDLESYVVILRTPNDSVCSYYCAGHDMMGKLFDTADHRWATRFDSYREAYDMSDRIISRGYTPRSIHIKRIMSLEEIVDELTDL